MFSKSTEYALRAVIFIAQKSSVSNKLSIESISKAIDSPPSFTAKILQQLTKNKGLIKATRGPHGGFYMTDDAKKLPARIILTTMGEDQILDKCVLGLNKCSSGKPCPMHDQYKKVKEQINKLFEHNSIDWLAKEIKKGDTYIRNKK